MDKFLLHQKLALDRLKEWNARMKRESKPYMMFNWKYVMCRVKARRRENSMMPKQIQKGERIRET